MGESSGFTGNTNKSRFFDPIVFQYKVLRFPAFVIDQGRRAGFRARVRRDVYRRKARYPSWVLRLRDPCVAPAPITVDAAHSRRHAAFNVRLGIWLIIGSVTQPSDPVSLRLNRSASLRASAKTCWARGVKSLIIACRCRAR